MAQPLAERMRPKRWMITLVRNTWWVKGQFYGK